MILRRHKFQITIVHLIIYLNHLNGSSKQTRNHTSLLYRYPQLTTLKSKLSKYYSVRLTADPMHRLEKSRTLYTGDLCTTFWVGIIDVAQLRIDEGVCRGLRLRKVLDALTFRVPTSFLENISYVD